VSDIPTPQCLQSICLHANLCLFVCLFACLWPLLLLACGLHQPSASSACLPHQPPPRPRCSLPMPPFEGRAVRRRPITNKHTHTYMHTHFTHPSNTRPDTMPSKVSNKKKAQIPVTVLTGFLGSGKTVGVCAHTVHWLCTFLSHSYLLLYPPSIDPAEPHPDRAAREAHRRH